MQSQPGQFFFLPMGGRVCCSNTKQPYLCVQGEIDDLLNRQVFETFCFVMYFAQHEKYLKISKIKLQLSKVVRIKIIPCNYNEVVPHIFVIRITCGKRDIVKQCLNDNGVATGIHYRPNHLLTLFTGNQNNTTLKHTDEIYEQLITLPLHADMVEDDVYYICGLIKKSI